MSPATFALFMLAGVLIVLFALLWMERDEDETVNQAHPVKVHEWKPLQYSQFRSPWVERNVEVQVHANRNHGAGRVANKVLYEPNTEQTS